MGGIKRYPTLSRWSSANQPYFQNPTFLSPLLTLSLHFPIINSHRFTAHNSYSTKHTSSPILPVHSYTRRKHHIGRLNSGIGGGIKPEFG
ncbi:hypothetical protein HanPSC8_Chr16g0712401 [Helianthus annuus]|nr:hypothetical protein HanPSC8_Chr16g0712401 [Helianthus annuus]